MTDLTDRLAKRGRIPEGGMFTDTMAACLDAKARITQQDAVIAGLVEAMKHTANMEPHPELIARAALAKAKESRDAR